eukprot:5341106-Amphidinium_carterae.3
MGGSVFGPDSWKGTGGRSRFAEASYWDERVDWQQDQLLSKQPLSAQSQSLNTHSDIDFRNHKN